MVKLNRKSGFKVVSFWLRTRGLGVRAPQGVCYKAPETAKTVTETAFSGAFFIYAPLCHFCSKPLFYYQIPCGCEGSVKEREGFVKVLLSSTLLFNFKFQQYALWVYFTFNQRVLGMITQETALRIWQCYREIEASQKLITVTLDIIRKLTIELEELNQGEKHCVLELVRIHTSIKDTCIHLEVTRCTHPHCESGFKNCVPMGCVRAHDTYSENLIKGVYNG